MAPNKPFKAHKPYRKRGGHKKKDWCKHDTSPDFECPKCWALEDKPHKESLYEPGKGT